MQQIARDLAGYSLGEADLLRRAMGKKIKKEMACAARATSSPARSSAASSARTPRSIFDACAKFAEYGFNKIALGALCAAHLSDRLYEGELSGRVPRRLHDARHAATPTSSRNSAPRRERLGIKVVPPSVNRSGVAFDVDGNAIHYALAALKGVGAQAVEAIVARARRAPVHAISSDFASRINPRAVNKRVLESLAACRRLRRARSKPRARLCRASTPCWRWRSARTKPRTAARSSSRSAETPARGALRLPKVEPWLPAERLQKEFDAIGFFLSGHPLDDYMPALKRMRVQSWVEFARAVKAGASAGRVAGTVVARTERRTRTGSKMGIIGLSDPSGHYEAVLFSEGLQQFRDLLEPGSAVLLTLSAELQGEDVRARIQMVEPLDQATAKLQKALRVFLRERGADRERRQAARRPRVTAKSPWC